MKNSNENKRMQAKIKKMTNELANSNIAAISIGYLTFSAEASAGITMGL
jgi:hypothetical protein